LNERLRLALIDPNVSCKEKGAAAAPDSFGTCRNVNYWPLDVNRAVLVPPRFLSLLDFLSPASAAAPLEQHPEEAEDDLLQEAPLVLAVAEAPFEQHPADFELSVMADLLSVDADAPLEQQLEDLDLSAVDLLASFEQVCSVLAFLSAGASVDCAEAANAKNAKAPRKNIFFMVVEFL